MEAQNQIESIQRKRELIVENRADTKEKASLSSDDGSSGYVSKALKPYWRGRIHRLAFYTTICLYVILFCTLNINKIYLSIYFASQLILYGVSSTYHLQNWKSRKHERLFRKLDHSSIFLLISGTQTCVVVAISELYKSSSLNIIRWLPVTYVLAAIGILKVFLFHTIPRYINVIYYIVHGSSVALFIPFSYIVREVLLCVLCVLGGILYIVGGVIYGIRKPDPFPKVFGYHEIFHVLTVLGNLSFLLTIVWADYKSCI